MERTNEFSEVNPNGNLLKQLNIISTEDLQPFRKENLYNLTIEALDCFELNEVPIIIQSITHLRRTFKFHYDLFQTTFDNIKSKFIQLGLNSKIYIIAMHSLVLVFDIFSRYESEANTEFSDKLLPACFDLLNNPSNEDIYSMILHTINAAGKNMLYDSTLNILFNFLCSKNPQIINVACGTLITFFESSERAALRYNYDWKQSFDVITEISLGQDNFEKEALKNVLLSLKNIMKEDFDVLVKENIADPDGVFTSLYTNN